MENSSKEIPEKDLHELQWSDFIDIIDEEFFNDSDWIFAKTNADLEKIPHYWVYLEESELMEYFIVFKNCLISKLEAVAYVLLKDIQIGLIFDNCVLPPITLKNCKTKDWVFIDSTIKGNFIISEQSDVYRLRLGGKTLVNSISLLGKSKCWAINISDNTRTGAISINSESVCLNLVTGEGCFVPAINVENSICDGIYARHNGNGVFIRDYSVTTFITVEGSSSFGGVSLYNFSTIQKIEIRNCKMDNIILSNNSQCDTIWLFSSKIDSLEIHKNTRCNFLVVKNSEAQNIDITDNQGDINLENAIISAMRLTNCYMPQLACLGLTKVQLFVYGGFINHLKFYRTSISRDALVSVIGVAIHIIQLQEFMMLGQLIFRHVTALAEPFERQEKSLAGYTEEKKYRADLDRFQHGDYPNYKKMIQATFDISIRPLFRIVDSSLGKTEITGSDLKNFYMEFRDSKILEMFISGTELPKNNIHIFQTENNDREWFIQKASINNQLKKICEIEGNIVEASWYHSEGMKNQGHLFQIQRKKVPKVSISIRIKNWFELKAFQLNNLSNNHGENWPRALLFTAGVAMLFYTFYYSAIFHKQDFSIKYTGQFLSDFFLFIDPTHKIDFLVEKNQLTPLSKVLDFFGRVFIAYGIFQFINAFRRHGRKNV